MIAALTALAALLTAVLAAHPDRATAQTHPPQAGTWIYAINYECGYQQSMYGVEGYEPPVKMGNYATKVDILNPLSVQVQLSGDVLNAPSWPAAGNGTGTVSVTPQPLANVNLAGGNSLRLDCADIAAAWGLPLPDLRLTFLTGVATVRSATPLAMWVTKTSEVCAGLVSSPIGDPVQAIYYDDYGNLQTAGGLSLGPAMPSLFGCPSVEIEPNSGTILQPGGMGIPGVVVPGLRPTGMILSIGSTQGLVTDISVSQSVDSEQVMGLFLPEP